MFVAMSREGLSQVRLRAELEVSAGQIGRWLRGERLPLGPARWSLFHRLGIDRDAWDQPPTKPSPFLSDHAA